MRVFAALLLAGVCGCGSRGAYCMTVSTSPDGRYRLEGWSKPGPFVAMPGGGGCSNNAGWVRLKDLRTGEFVDDAPTDSLQVVGREVWDPHQVTVEVGQTDLVTRTFPLPR